MAPGHASRHRARRKAGGAAGTSTTPAIPHRSRGGSGSRGKVGEFILLQILAKTQK
jgi:hypothetical protein